MGIRRTHSRLKPPGSPRAELFQQDETDTHVDILQCLFTSMLTVLRRRTGDHLLGAKFSCSDPITEEKSKSALMHNKLTEFFFGQMDRLMKFRPNSTSLYNESHLVG